MKNPSDDAAERPEGADELGHERETNVPKATKTKHYNACRKAKAAFDAAQKTAKEKQGEYRATLKAADEAGVDKTAIAYILKNKDKEPEDMDRLHKNINEMAVIAKVPWTSQLSMFENGESVAARVEREDQDAGDNEIRKRKKAEEDGEVAGAAGTAREKNPHESGSIPAQRWDLGWERGQAKLAEGSFRGDGKKPH